jgi:hypothetical protein
MTAWGVWYQRVGEPADLPPVTLTTFEKARIHAAWVWRTSALVGKPRIARCRW